MWLASKHGFYSIVQKSPGQFHVRARVKQDLENLLGLLAWEIEIYRWPGADYRFRIIIGEQHLHALLSALGQTLDYDNFKSKISSLPDQQKRLHAYNTIWATMARLQDIHETLTD